MAAEQSEGEDPAIERLLRPTPSSQKWLTKRIRTLRSRYRTEMGERRLADEAGVSIEILGNFMRGKSLLAPEPHRKLVDYLWRNRWGTEWGEDHDYARHPEALFHALIHFLDVNEQSLRNLAEEAQGLYTLWRASTHVPGKYVKGMMKIEHDRDSHTVETTETQIYSGRDGTVSISEEFDGFIIKKSRHYVMFARQTGHSGPPRITIIDNALFDDDRIVIMQGMTTGCYGANALYCAPVYLERALCTEQELRGQLDIIDSVPESIKAKLSVQLSDGIIWF